MTIAAHLQHLDPTPQQTRAERRVLRLDTFGVSASADASEVCVHNISASGLLLETAAEMAPGETIAIDLPLADECRATVVWQSGDFYGCQFTEPLSQAALSAAELRSEAGARGSAQGSHGASFGERLQRLRTERGLTLANVADRLGVSKPTVWAWEHGKARPLGSRLAALASLLEVSRPTLLNEAPSQGLEALVAQSREQIAAAYGIDPERVKISVTL